MLASSLVPTLFGGGSGGTGGGGLDLSSILTMFQGGAGAGPAAGASSGANPIAGLVGSIGRLFGLAGQSRGAAFRAGVRQQIANSAALSSTASLLRSAGFNPVALRGTSQGSTLLQLANQIDEAGGWQAVAQGAGPLKTLRKTWQYLTTGEMVDPKRPIPTTAQIRAALAPTGSSSGSGALSIAMPNYPNYGSSYGVGYFSPPTLVGAAGGSYWSRMGTVYGGF